jgi:hypothetical protein
VPFERKENVYERGDRGEKKNKNKETVERQGRTKIKARQ